jgi:FMN-dependent NADH-azoreductase
MTTILHLDSSARSGKSGVTPYGSHSRRLSSRFVDRWKAARSGDTVIRRDVGLEPPPPVSGAWIHAAFTKPNARTKEMNEALRMSDTLVDELIAADVIVAGVPLYNFGVPSSMKAYIDNVVRVGRTFGFDRSRPGERYWPLLTPHNKTLVVLSSRGDFGYGPGERIAHMNHVEPHLRTAFGYIGITDLRSVAIEYDEFADERLVQSIAEAEAGVDALVEQLLVERCAAAGKAA